MQQKQTEGFYEQGIFRSTRSHSYFPYKRDDNNIFFSVLIALILNRYKTYLRADLAEEINQIVLKVLSATQHYKSNLTPGFYNFYLTDGSPHYPNGRILQNHKHFRLADDADDTALIHLLKLEYYSQKGQQEQVKEECISVLNKLAAHNQSKGDRKEHLPASFRDFSAYGVWCGTPAMPLEYDICVLSNVLCLVFASKKPLRQIDFDSLKIIDRAITTGALTTRPFKWSYTYAHPALIFYHLARLSTYLPKSEEYLSIADLKKQVLAYQTERLSLYHRMLVDIALHKLGKHPSLLDLGIDRLHLVSDNNTFFYAPMLAGTSLGFLNAFAKAKITWLSFNCKAHTLALAVEYLLLTRAKRC